MTIGFVRIGKVAMATIGTVWTVSNVQLLYKQTKLFFLLPSSYTFLFFHVILLSLLFQYSSFASTLRLGLSHLLRQADSPRNPTTAPQQAPPRLLENQLSRSFSHIWHRIMDHKEEDNTLLEPTPLEEDQLGCCSNINEDDGYNKDEDVVLEEDDKGTMEETWKAIMEGKKRAEERELKKSNTWDVTPTIEQMKGRPFELESSKSLKAGEDHEINGGNKDCWGWRRIETMLSRDELNLRAEEFITKIKHTIRLERLESYNLFLQVTNRRPNI